MGRKSATSASSELSDEHREHLTSLHAALGAVLALAAGSGAGAPADDTAGGGDDLENLGGGADSELDGLGDEPKDDAPSEEDLRTALKKVLKAKGKDAGRELVAKILKKYDAATIADVDEDKRADVIKTAEKAIK